MAPARSSAASLPAASLAACLLAGTAAPALADFKLCNRMSYVVEAAIAFEDGFNVATRGWFRVDPAQCRSIAQGAFGTGRILLHARALAVYGASPAPQGGGEPFCVGEGDFVVATGRACRGGQRPAPFVEVKPTTTEDGHTVATLAEDAKYDDEQARLAAIQRLLVIAGYDAAPIDGVDGPKTAAALARFLKDRNLAAEAAQAPGFFEVLLAAVQSPSGTGLTWCNDTPHRVMAAIGLGDGKAITTRGWYRVEPGKCLHPDMEGQPRRVFSYAEAVDGEGRVLKPQGKPLTWGGATTLCTREAKFELSEQGDCAARGLATAGFAAVDMSAETGKTLRFKLP